MGLSKGVSKADEFLIVRGMTAVQLVVRLPEIFPQCRAFTFLTYEPSPGLEERITKKGKTLRQVFKDAAVLRRLSDGRLPYWESVLTMAWASRALDILLAEATRHSSSSEAIQRFEVSAADLTASFLTKLLAEVPPTNALAVCSRCKMEDGSICHIPMTDFRAPPGAANLRSVKRALGLIGDRSGVLLRSGRSYHYYGFRLLSEDGQTDFLAKALLLAPLVDTRYIAHRLLERNCVLRIGASHRKPEVPIVVSVL